MLDLYQGRWEGEPLRPTDAVLSADEITGLQAVSRCHPGTPPAPGRRARTEFEYERHGTLCYAAFLEVRTGRVFGQTSDRSCIESFETALAHCLAQPHTQSWERIFLILDNGPSHHPDTSPARLAALDPRITTGASADPQQLAESGGDLLLHPGPQGPQRRDIPSVAALREQISRFEGYYNLGAEPFHWRFSRTDLERYVERLGRHEALYAETAAALADRRERTALVTTH